MCGGRVQRKTSQNSQINEMRPKKNMTQNDIERAVTRERSENGGQDK